MRYFLLGLALAWSSASAWTAALYLGTETVTIDRPTETCTPPSVLAPLGDIVIQCAGVERLRWHNIPCPQPSARLVADKLYIGCYPGWERRAGLLA